MAGYNVVDAEQTKNLLHDKKAILLDVRTLEEYEAGHIVGAVLLPYDIVEQKAMGILEKDDCIVVYCRSGHRSKIAALKLLEMGYTDVYDLGSIDNWPDELTAPQVAEIK